MSHIHAGCRECAEQAALLTLYRAEHVAVAKQGAMINSAAVNQAWQYVEQALMYGIDFDGDMVFIDPTYQEPVMVSAIARLVTAAKESVDSGAALNNLRTEVEWFEQTRQRVHDGMLAYRTQEVKKVTGAKPPARPDDGHAYVPSRTYAATEKDNPHWQPGSPVPDVDSPCSECGGPVSAHRFMSLVGWPEPEDAEAGDEGIGKPRASEGNRNDQGILM